MALITSPRCAHMQWLTNCHADGMPIYGCTSVKAIATLASMESNVNPFLAASP